MHRVLLDRLGEADQIDWERASLDSACIPAKRGAQKPERIRQIKERRAPSATLLRTEGRPAGGNAQRSKRPRLDGEDGVGELEESVAPGMEAFIEGVTEAA